MTRRDRHGRVKSLSGLSTFEEWKAENAAFMLYEVDKIARRIFVNRNAAGAPPRFRAEIRKHMRPTLKKAAKFAGEARAALLRGDEKGFEINKLYAHLCLERAQVIFRQPFMDRYRKAAEGGKRGGRPPSEYDDDWLKMFNARKVANPDQSQIAICKWISARWEGPEGETRTWRAIEEGIKRSRK